MNLLIDFLIYLTAFAVGAGLTWLIVGSVLPDRTAEAARARLATPEGSQP
jgi:hypothetical protein